MVQPWDIRLATVGDIDAMFHIRASTRDNAIAPDRLASLGITPASVRDAMLDSTARTWVCQARNAIVAFCSAEAGTGEVTVLAVLKGHDGQGMGRALLDEALQFLQASGCPKIWLTAGADATLRSHGFYRANGWQPTGRTVPGGDEELVYVGSKGSPLSPPPHRP